MIQLRYVVSIAAILSLASLHPSNADDAANATKYRDLVRQLVSQNAAPTLRERYGEYTVTFPKDYDFAAQLKVEVARQELHKNLEAAFPYLVEVLDDKRYCMTTTSPEREYSYNRSVGNTCLDIIRSHLEIYRDKIRTGTKEQFHHYTYAPISKAWGIKRKGGSLVELQVEAIGWAIDRRKTEPGPLWDGREREVEELTQLREKIAESKRAAKPEPMLAMVTRDIPATTKPASDHDGADPFGNP